MYLIIKSTSNCVKYTVDFMFALANYQSNQYFRNFNFFTLKILKEKINKNSNVK